METARQLSIFDIKPQAHSLPVLYPDLKKAERLNKIAERMQKQIDSKLNPAIGQQRPTARRARIAHSIREDGQKLVKIQSCLRAIAAAAERGDLPSILSKITTKSQVELILMLSNDRWRDVELQRIFTNENNRYEDWLKKLAKIEVKSVSQLRRVIQTLKDLSPSEILTPEKKAQIKIQDLERELIGVKIPGYFPTPKDICQQLVDLAELEDGMNVLEPSGGKGSISEAIRDKAHVNLEVCEIYSDLSKILTLKGFKVVANNFLTEVKEPKYNRVIMNPPFSDGQDIQHIRHAFNCLAPDGKIVAIASESISFRKDLKYKEFRDWLEDKCSINEPLPKGSFLKSDRPTGINARILVIEN